MGYQVEPNVFSAKVMSVREAAYTAGLFDGEGSIYLVARKGKGRQSHQFLAEMCIGNSNLALLQRVVEMTGNGRIMLNKRPTGSNHKQVYVWQLAPRQIQHVLPQLVDDLVAKRRQAEIALEYFAIQQRGARADGKGRTRIEDIPEVLALHAEIQQLNHRGLSKVEALEFTLRDEAERPTRFCQQQGCTDRAYRGQQFCYKHWLHQREPVIKKCEECGGPMDAILPRKRFCSPKCQWQNSYRRRNAGLQPELDGLNATVDEE